MMYHGTLTPITRDAVVALAAANDPTVPAFCLTASQLELRDMARALARADNRRLTDYFTGIAYGDAYDAVSRHYGGL